MTVMDVVEDCLSFLAGNDISCPLQDEAIFCGEFLSKCPIWLQDWWYFFDCTGPS